MAGRSSLGTGALQLSRWVCSLLAIIAGLLAVAVLFRDAPWSWLLVILAGVAGGAVAGSPRDAWIALLAVPLEYPIAVALAMAPASDPLWYVDLLGAAVLTCVGFIPGTAIGWRGDRVAASAAQWRGMPRRARLLVVACLVGVALLPLLYGGVIALIALDKWTADPNTDCRTPQYAYGWAYEAINYDQATDAALQPPSWVAALGNSMGAAAALAEAANDMRVRALVLDSMHANAVVTIGNILETEEHLPAVPAAWAIVALTSWRLGVDVAAIDPVSTITRLGDRPVLLIHGTADAIDRPEQSADANLHAALAAGVPAELGYCLGGTHGGLVDNPDCAADWSRWANSFLEDARNR